LLLNLELKLNDKETNATLWSWGWNNEGQLGDGTLWTWSYNADGQMGDGTYEPKTTPIQIVF
jgi:hypothetical protein